MHDGISQGSVKELVREASPAVHAETVHNHSYCPVSVSVSCECSEPSKFYQSK